MPTLLPIVELAVKGRIWGCRMCGQCVLHSTAMTCPMTCPKSLRNGPCGGVRPDGACEVDPAMPCVWVTAERRSRSPMNPRAWREEFHELRPPVNNELVGTSSWVNFATGRDRLAPSGWSGGVVGESKPFEVSLVELDEPCSPQPPA